MKREIKIGLFAVAMLVCLYLGVNYLKGKDLFSGDRTYYTLFDQTRGLQTSAPVTLWGVKVGSVISIEIDPANSGKVVVGVGIKRGVAVPVDSHLKLFSDGIMGGKSIELVRGSSDDFFERGAVIPSEIEGGIFESASVSMNEIAGEAKVLMKSLSATSATLDTLLVQNVVAIRGIMANLEAATGQISGAGIGEVIGDVRAFTGALRSNASRLDSIIGDARRISGAVADADLRGTIDTLGVSISHLNVLLAGMAEGEGTVGKLLHDPALYDSLTLATGRLSALLEDLKANPKKYVHFSVF